MRARRPWTSSKRGSLGLLLFCTATAAAAAVETAEALAMLVLLLVEGARRTAQRPAAMSTVPGNANLLAKATSQ